ncbi:MAG: hypothetical protein DDT32_00426 [Syntrophomonadaceae bacterium]|nr:hypothetical protein [Bacillota bacterium]MBT9146689.1 hypothetical protein [Bacillota bacterium]
MTNVPENLKLVFNVVDAAEILGISRGLAYSLVRCGKLPAIRLGRRILIPKRAIEQLLEKSNLTGLS